MSRKIQANPTIDLTGPQASWPAAALRLWSEATERVLGSPDSWHPPPLQGEQRLREVLGAIFGADPDQILVTSGVRATASVVGRHAHRILHERPSFTGTVAVLRSFHSDLELHPWADLSAALAAGPAGGNLIWLTTPFRNPDGVTLTPADWRWIDAVDEHNQVIVNEVYRWFAPPTPGSGRVWLTGSLSKLAGSGAGLGWIRGPGVHRVAEQQHSRPSRFWQRCWCHVLERGGIDLFIDHTVRPAAAACDAFTTELRRVTGLDCRPSSGGRPPFLLLPVPTRAAREFVDLLAFDGINVGSGDDFLAARPGIRVCFVGVSEGDARRAARTIGARLTAGRPHSGSSGEGPG